MLHKHGLTTREYHPLFCRAWSCPVETGERIDSVVNKMPRKWQNAALAAGYGELRVRRRATAASGNRLEPDLGTVVPCTCSCLVTFHFNVPCHTAG